MRGSTPVMPVNQGWWVYSQQFSCGWLADEVNLSCTRTVPPVHWMALKWCGWALLNVWTMAPPLSPNSVAYKNRWNVSWLCGRRNHRETRNKASTENQSCLGERAKGLRAKAGRGQLAELGVSSRFLSGLPWIWSAEGLFSRPWCSSASSDHLMVHFAYPIL